MASKQELELMVVELQRQVGDLTQKLKDGASDLPVQDDSVIHQLQDELRRSLTENEEALGLLKNEREAVQDLTKQLVEAQKELNGRPTPAKSSGEYELEVMQAWELLDLVKYQFLAKDAEVAVLRKR